MNFTAYLRQLAADYRESGYTATAYDLDEAAARLEDAAELFHTIADPAEEANTFEQDPYFREIGRMASTAALDMVTR
jgi:hypothetical protein